MKLILDEWIVREVIDTLYMARTTLLGITGLDSPQDVEKKSANETAITRRISKAIDIIQQSDEQQHAPEGLEEAAEEYAYTNWEDNDYHEGASEGLPFDAIGHTEKCFKAGAEWQKEQMMKDAAEGEVVKDISNKLAVTAKNVNLDGFKFGDKVQVIIVKEEEK